MVVPGQLSSQVWNTLGELAWVNRIVTEVWHMHLALPTLCTVDEPGNTANAMVMKIVLVKLVGGGFTAHVLKAECEAFDRALPSRGWCVHIQECQYVISI